MISGSWCLYERRSNRFIFGRRKQLIGAPLVTVMAVSVLLAAAHFF